MNASHLARSAIGIAVLLLAGLLSGCNDQPDRGTAVEVVAERTPHQPRSPSGTPAAKGRELMAVATVRSWVAVRNEARNERWTLESARVTQHTVDSATVEAQISVTARSHPRERLTRVFEVNRVAGSPTVTKVDVLP